MPTPEHPTQDMQEPATARQIALAFDAFETVKACPEHGPAWWHLMGNSTWLPPEPMARLIKLVLELQVTTPHAHWFRFSALYGLTGDSDYLVGQARLAFTWPDTQRWMALAQLVWAHALSHASDRHEFRQYFIATKQVELLASMSPAPSRPLRRTSARTRLRRVAVVASHISSAAHAPTALAFNLRARLEAQGLATWVFSAQESFLPAMSSYSANGHKPSMGPTDPDTWPVRTNGTVSVTLSDQEFSPAARWAQLLEMIDDFDPDLVLFVGFSSPLVWALYQRYPILAMSLHTVAPIAPVDVWLAADPEAGPGSFWPGLPLPEPVHYPFRFWPTESRGAPLRGAIDVPQEAVLLVTSGYRLESEITAAWAGEMVRFLQARPQVHWLLVGAHDSHDIQHSAQMRRLPHQGDLAGWIGICDIYVNPPRMGGGASVAMAMEQGVAVVSMGGSDGGDKIGALAAADIPTYFQRLSAWVADADLRKRAGQELQARFRDELDLTHPAASKGLLNACRQAVACFEKRTRAGHSIAMPINEIA